MIGRYNVMNPLRWEHLLDILVLGLPLIAIFYGGYLFSAKIKDTDLIRQYPVLRIIYWSPELVLLVIGWRLGQQWNAKLNIQGTCFVRLCYLIQGMAFALSPLWLMGGIICSIAGILNYLQIPNADDLLMFIVSTLILLVGVPLLYSAIKTLEAIKNAGDR